MCCVNHKRSKHENLQVLMKLICELFDCYGFNVMALTLRIIYVECEIYYPLFNHWQIVASVRLF